TWRPSSRCRSCPAPKGPGEGPRPARPPPLSIVVNTEARRSRFRGSDFDRGLPPVAGGDGRRRLGPGEPVLQLLDPEGLFVHRLPELEILLMFGKLDEFFMTQLVLVRFGGRVAVVRAGFEVAAGDPGVSPFQIGGAPLPGRVH